MLHYMHAKHVTAHGTPREGSTMRALAKPIPGLEGGGARAFDRGYEPQLRWRGETHKQNTNKNACPCTKHEIAHGGLSSAAP